MAGRNHSRRAITLVELLVVIAIVGVLLALTTASVQRVRAAAARTRCLNNLRQLSLSLHGYHDKHEALPHGWTLNPNKTSLAYISWQARVLPHLEQDSLWNRILVAYDSDPNPLSGGHPPHDEIRATPVPVFFCSMDGRGPVAVIPGSAKPTAFTSYLGISGVNSRERSGCLFLNSAVKMTDVKDGTSNTLLIGERPPSADLIWGWWYRGVGQNADGSAEVVMGVRELNYSMITSACPPGPYPYQPGALKEQCDLFHFWSLHPGGAHFAFADGSVRFLRYDADSVLPALATRAGGESVNIPE